MVQYFFLFLEHYLFHHLNPSFPLCAEEDDSLSGEHTCIYSFIQHVSLDNNYISDTL